MNFVLKKYLHDLIIFWDENSIGQIIVNPSENAIKCTNEGFVEVSSFMNGEGRAIVKITEIGIGIFEEYLSYLFTPFSQEEPGHTWKYEGNGLGLALVKKYCEMNNAEIFVESIKGKGTTFTVVFNSLEKL